jgi:RNA polymerase sigma-70 factor (ECF subfamily)
MLPEERDEEIMAQIARGESHLLERLIRRHATPLLTFIRRMIGDRHRSEELFQEVFLTVWTKRRQYQFPRSFKNWLYAIALNKCRETFRARSLAVVPLPEQDSLAPLADDGSPAEGILAAEMADCIAQAVLRLPPQQRAVVTLRVWESMAYGRIAQIVGCTEGTVRSHMHLALVALRKELEPHMGVR